MAPDTREKMRKAWTPARRKRQAQIMRERMRKRANGAARGKEAPRSVPRNVEAVILLREACRYIQNGYKEGESVTASDTYVFQALHTLEGKR